MKLCPTLLIEKANVYLKKINQIIPVAAYITIRPNAVLEGTKHWLEKHHFPAAPIICKPDDVAHSAGNEWKARLLSELYPLIIGIIDDNPKLLSCLPTDYPGKVFLYDHHDNFGLANVIPSRDWLAAYKNIKNNYNNLKPSI